MRKYLKINTEQMQAALYHARQNRLNKLNVGPVDSGPIQLVNTHSGEIAAGSGIPTVDLSEPAAEWLENDFSIATVTCTDAFNSTGSQVLSPWGLLSWTPGQQFANSYRRHGATVTSTIRIRQDPSAPVAYQVRTYRGVDTSTYLDVPRQNDDVFASPITPADVTPVTNNARVVVLGVYFGVGTITNLVFPSDYSNGEVNERAGCNIFGMDKTVEVAAQEQPGDIPFEYADGGSGRIMTMTIALRPQL